MQNGYNPFFEDQNLSWAYGVAMRAKLLLGLFVSATVLIWVNAVIGGDKQESQIVPHVPDDPVLNNSDDPVMENDSLNVRLVARYPMRFCYSVALDRERNIAYVGSSDSVTILDISDPSSPLMLSGLPTPGFWGQGLLYLDNYLYIADCGLQIVLVEDPQNPEVVGQYGGCAQRIAVEDTLAYVSFDITGGQGYIQVLSIADPSNPVMISEYWPPSTPWEIVIADSLAYLADEYAGLRILSISDPANLHEVGFYWTPIAVDVVLLDSLAYIGDYTGIPILSVADPANPSELGFYETPGDVMDISINGSLAYVADWDGGLRVLSIPDLLNPVETGYYVTGSRVNSVSVSDQYAYVAAGEEGCLIFEYYGPTSIGEEGNRDITLPRSFSLSQNYPNPFNPSTSIKYSVPAGHSIPIRLMVYDVRGRLIRTLVNEEKHPGLYSVYWDGRDERGREVGSGTYLYRIATGNFTSTKKMVVLR